jgi:hypothetical protein
MFNALGNQEQDMAIGIPLFPLLGSKSFFFFEPKLLTLYIFFFNKNESLLILVFMEN